MNKLLLIATMVIFTTTASAGTEEVSERYYSANNCEQYAILSKTDKEAVMNRIINPLSAFLNVSESEAITLFDKFCEDEFKKPVSP